MYGVAPLSTGDAERTAFRRAEKRYKFYKPPDSKSRRKQACKETDLSDVIDFRSILAKFQSSGETPPGIYRLHCPGFLYPVFCFENRPGFYFIPGVLSIDEQCFWIRESLITFPQPPNRTNHTAIYGPIQDLFISARMKKVLVEHRDLTTKKHGVASCQCGMVDHKYHFCESSATTLKEETCKAIEASVLLRKLRWSTLGLQFNWSKRNYDVSLPYLKIPDALCLLAKKMAIPAIPSGEEFKPEAAIVNYFGSSDMLGGHLDDMEADWTKPIVSISLGCKAIFLLGGRCREDSPIAMFLRSGDIVLMAGKARECFHGIPRIFTDNESSDIVALKSNLSSMEDLSYLEYVSNSRININIRQVN